MLLPSRLARALAVALLSVWRYTLRANGGDLPRRAGEPPPDTHALPVWSQRAVVMALPLHGTIHAADPHGWLVGRQRAWWLVNDANKRGVRMDKEQQTVNRDEEMRRISRALSDQMGFAVTVTASGKSLVLEGAADSDAGRAEAAATLQELAPRITVINHLTVDPSRRAQRDGYADHDRPGDLRVPAGFESLDVAVSSDFDPGFDDQPLETNASNVTDESVADLDVPAEPDPAYFAPTDPVVGLNDQGGLEVIGGFDATSMTSDEVDRATSDGQPGDEAIADAVRRELREDAETTALSLSVEVVEGVVRLRGRVDDLTDAENAEAVASRVPGVREVIDETDVPGL